MTFDFLADGLTRALVTRVLVFLAIFVVMIAWGIWSLKNESARYVLKRVLQGLLTLLLATAFSFFIVQLAPGDFLTPFRQNPQITPDTIAGLERRFGLDRPVWVQYFLWLKQVVTAGDFGRSFAYNRPALDILWERVPNTILLSAASILVTWAI
ncbi:MAG: ABC transporter permease, partial [Cyanobacteria bacterium J06576_12]